MKVNTKELKDREAPPKFIGRFSEDGGLNFGSYTKVHLKKFIKENPNMPFELKPLLPESEDQRGYFEGGICSLVAFYQEGMDHRNYKDREKVREWLKIEFNGDLVALHGKTHKIAKSTKNRLNSGFLERVMEWLEENYKPPLEAVDPTKYKYWKDVIFSNGGPDNYIDYLREIKLL